MRNKIIVGTTLAVGMLVILILGGVPLLVLTSTGTAFGLWEYYTLLNQKQVRPLAFLGIGIGLLFVLTAFWSMRVHNLIWGSASMGAVVSLSVFGILVIQFVQIVQGRGRYSILDLAVTIFGSVYVGGLISFVFPLFGIGMERFPNSTPLSRLVPFMPMWAAWGSDVGAYFFGSFFGRNRIFPELSPKKTAEGMAGGVLFSVIGMCLMGAFISIPLSHAFLLGIVASLAGQIGDLSESALKREFGVKDSGRIFASHGGFLDRMDSLLFTLPVVYYYFVWFRPWGD